MAIKFFCTIKPLKVSLGSPQMLFMVILFSATCFCVHAKSDSDFNKRVANVINDTIFSFLLFSLVIAFFRILSLLEGRPYASLQGVPIYAESEEAKREGAPPPLTCGGDKDLYNTLRNGSPTFFELVLFGLNIRVCIFSVISSFILSIISPSHENLSYKDVAINAVSNTIIDSAIFLACVSIFRSGCTDNGRIRATNEGYAERYHGPIYGSISSTV